jgi:hypothetical protein
MASNRKIYITKTSERGRDKLGEGVIDMPYSYGRSVPRNGLYACLCADKNTYSRKCCKGYLINQGIGNIYGVQGPASFSQAFDKSFQGGFMSTT